MRNNLNTCKDKIANSIQKVSIFMEKHIKEFSHRLFKSKAWLKGTLVSFHELMLKNSYYKLIVTELLVIMGTGFLLSIALVSFGLQWKPWLSLSYGLVPWLVVRILVAAKDELL